MHELDYAKMGTRIRQLRKAKGWSQERLAKKCGISLNFMGHIERGTRKISMDTFVALCRELETDADALLWGVAQPFETAAQGMWGHQEQTGDDGYAMYIQIMKSVADIMKSKGKKRRYEDHTTV
ncbi:MAG: helix-turn-helix domain-containing protein [Eubacterium sp.]|nr:helix-turn-helix domain-containing protein [Eubacterium sp.]